MKKVILCLLLITLVFNCKSDKKKVKEPSSQVKDEVPKTSKSKAFESKLLDLRDVNLQFTNELKVNKFGMKYVNDSIYAFVLNLDPSTYEETVDKYSYGVKGFSQGSKPTFTASFSPNITIVNDEKYLIMRKKIKDIKYFDSLEIYIYARNDWKKSGRLGGIKVRDVLLEKNK